MGGLAVLALLGLYGFLAITVFQAAKTTSAKVIAALLILLIPTADAIYGRIKLQQLCKVEAGLKVYRVAQGVEGFMGYADENLVRDYGFQFVETERYKTPGNYIYTRYFRFAKKNGEFVIEEDENPKSKYRFRNIHNYEMPNYDKQQLINRSQEVVENIETGEILASYTHLTFGGGWAERFLAMFSDAGPGNVAWCSTEPFLNKPYVDSIQLLITSSLEP